MTGSITHSVGHAEPFDHPPQKEATRTGEHCSILRLCSTCVDIHERQVAGRMSATRTVYGGCLALLVIIEDSTNAPSLVATTTGDNESHDFVEHAPRPNVVITLTAVGFGVTAHHTANEWRRVEGKETWCL